MTRGRILVAALLLSLAVNAFLLAYGLTSRRSGIGLMHPAPISLAYRVAGLLPEPGGRSLTLKLDDLRPELERELELYRAALTRGAALMEHDRVDQVALTRAIEEARQHRSRIGDLLTGAFVTTVAELPLDMRRRLVARFMKTE